MSISELNHAMTYVIEGWMLFSAGLIGTNFVLFVSRRIQEDIEAAAIAQSEAQRDTQKAIQAEIQPKRLKEAVAQKVSIPTATAEAIETKAVKAKATKAKATKAKITKVTKVKVAKAEALAAKATEAQITEAEALEREAEEAARLEEVAAVSEKLAKTAKTKDQQSNTSSVSVST